MTFRLAAVDEIESGRRDEVVAAMAQLHAGAFHPGWRAAEMAALLDHSGAVGLVLQHDSVMEAFLIARLAADEAEVLTIVTAPPARRRGHGRTLLTALKSVLRARGVVKVFLEVAEDNAPARALYAAAGYVEVGRRRGYYPRPGAEPVAALVLENRVACD